MAILNVGFIPLLVSVFAMAALLQIFASALSKTKYIFPRYVVYFALFVIYTICSDIILAGQQLTIKYIYSNSLIGSVLALLVVENYKNFNKKIINNLHFIFLITIIVALIVILIQENIDKTFFVFTARYTSDLTRVDISENRLPSIFSWTGVLDIGFVFIPLLSLVIGHIIYKKKKTASLYFIIGAIVVFLSRNRWIMVNYLVLFFMYLTYYKANVKNFMKYTIGLLIILYLAMTILYFADVPVMRIIDDRILEKSKGGLEEGSAGSRIFAIQIFAELFPENIIFGKGMLHSFGGDSRDYKLVKALEGRSSQIHIGYLSLLYYYGLIGGFLYLSFLVLIVKKLFKDAKITSYWGPFFGFVGYVFANFTLVSISFLYAGLILCLFYNKIMLNYRKYSMLNGRI